MNLEIRVQAVLAEIEASLDDHRPLAARAELALALARKLDDGTAGPSTAAISKELRAVLAELQNVRPNEEFSKLDELAMRRKLRLVDLLEEYDRRVAAKGDGRSGRRRA